MKWNEIHLTNVVTTNAITNKTMNSNEWSKLAQAC